MLRSLGGDQLYFVFRAIPVAHKGDSSIRSGLCSVKWRLDRGEWDELLIVEYARRAGITLDNVALWRAAEKHLRRHRAA